MSHRSGHRVISRLVGQSHGKRPASSSRAAVANRLGVARESGSASPSDPCAGRKREPAPGDRARATCKLVSSCRCSEVILLFREFLANVAKKPICLDFCSLALALKSASSASHLPSAFALRQAEFVSACLLAPLVCLLSLRWSFTNASYV